MDMILTGRNISADEALQWGLVARVIPDSEVLGTAIASAAQITSYSRPVVLMAKEAINAGTLSSILREPSKANNVLTTADEVTLSQGLL